VLYRTLSCNILGIPSSRGSFRRRIGKSVAHAYSVVIEEAVLLLVGGKPQQ